MVSTRNHPVEFTPTSPKSPSSTSSRAITPSSSHTSPSNSNSTAQLSTRPWAHTPSNLTLLWLAISLPLVIWDTGYVLLRPYSMPGGGLLHDLFWKPYALYGTVDYIYGFPAWEAKNGFTAGQGMLNAVETVGYMWYLWIVWRKGVEVGGKGRGAPWGIGYGLWGKRAMRPRRVEGREAGLAVVVGFAVAVMTLSKTVLYWLSEYFSGFENIGHNSAMNILILWIIPNGLWLVFPTYMIYVFGQEILEGLNVAGGEGKKA